MTSTAVKSHSKSKANERTDAHHQAPKEEKHDAPATNEALFARRAAALPRGVGASHPIIIARALDSELWDIEGKRYIDFCAGIGVVNTGHGHPEVVAAVQAQAAKFLHTCFMVAGYESYIELCERLCKLAPGTKPKKAFLVSTGAEAIENAVKFARAATKRPAVIAFNGAFHGRTMLALALTGKVVPYKVGFGHHPAGVFHVPYPSKVGKITTAQALAAIEDLFKVDVEASQVAAILVEPVLGEGGYTPAPPEFLQGIRAICDRHGIVMIADEIQTGMGRAGTMFAVEHSGVVPDLITVAKGLGGGMPIAGVIGSADLMDVVGPGGYGGTFAGNPLSCVAALAVLNILERDNLCARSMELGERIRSQFKSMAIKHRFICDVRGLGAMTGVELCVDGDPERPSSELATAVTRAALKRGLLVLSCGQNANVIRIICPLTISNALLDEGLNILAACFDEVEPQDNSSKA